MRCRPLTLERTRTRRTLRSCACWVATLSPWRSASAPKSPRLPAERATCTIFLAQWARSLPSSASCSQPRLRRSRRAARCSPSATSPLSKVCALSAAAAMLALCMSTRARLQCGSFPSRSATPLPASRTWIRALPLPRDTRGARAVTVAQTLRTAEDMASGFEERADRSLWQPSVSSPASAISSSRRAEVVDRQRCVNDLAGGNARSTSRARTLHVDDAADATSELAQPELRRSAAQRRDRSASSSEIAGDLVPAAGSLASHRRRSTSSRSEQDADLARHRKAARSAMGSSDASQPALQQQRRPATASPGWTPAPRSPRLTATRSTGSVSEIARSAAAFMRSASAARLKPVQLSASSAHSQRLSCESQSCNPVEAPVIEPAERHKMRAAPARQHTGAEDRPGQAAADEAWPDLACNSPAPNLERLAGLGTVRDLCASESQWSLSLASRFPCKDDVLHHGSQAAVQASPRQATGPERAAIVPCCDRRMSAGAATEPERERDASSRRSSVLLSPAEPPPKNGLEGGF